MICERMLRECAAMSPLTFMALRYFNAAGADPEGEIGECHVPETHAIPLLLDAAAGDSKGFTIFGDDYPTADGTCVRDYIHVSDLADAHVAALRALIEGAGSATLNLGTGRGWSVRELVDSVRRITKRDVRRACRAAPARRSASSGRRRRTGRCKSSAGDHAIPISTCKWRMPGLGGKVQVDRGSGTRRDSEHRQNNPCRELASIKAARTHYATA